MVFIFVQIPNHCIMKRAYLVFVTAGLLFSACGGAECITCTGDSSVLNACSDDAQFANDAAWDTYVTASSAQAAEVIECIECSGAPSGTARCSNDSDFNTPEDWDTYVAVMEAGFGNCDITTTGGNTCTVE